jgi:Ras-related protein Rab-8A
MISKNYKITIIGDTGVGKSSIVYSFINGEKFNGTMIPTIGVAFMTKTISINENKIILQIWDTAGQERFRSIARLYYKDSFGCLCVFDLTSRKSFDGLNIWIRDYLDGNNSNNHNIIIIGNKSDMDKDFWAVSEDEISYMCIKYSCKYLSTSSITGYNINQAFEMLAENIQTTQMKSYDISDTYNPKVKTCGSCYI